MFYENQFLSDKLSLNHSLIRIFVSKIANIYYIYHHD